MRYMRKCCLATLLIPPRGGGGKAALGALSAWFCRVTGALLASALLASCGGGGDGPVSVVPVPPGTISYGNDRLLVRDYGGFVLLFDCTLHVALRYQYTLTKDTGNFARPSGFSFDPTLPADCSQQTSTASYASVMPGWDRGHLVTSNHMDYNADYILRANYMSNVVPQVAVFNQGIWLAAENVAECYRDLAPVQVYGGVVFTDTRNDFFLASHGVPTPERFWKVIVTTDAATAGVKAIAWIMPNQAALGTLDSYLVSIAELEQILGTAMVGVDVPAAVKAGKPATSWPLPAGCSTS